MYQNIILDLGGVVVDYAPREFLVDYFMNEKLEEQLFLTQPSAAKNGRSWTPGSSPAKRPKPSCAGAGLSLAIPLRWMPF